MGKCMLCGQEKPNSHTFEQRSKKLPNMAAAISPPAGMTGPPPGFSARRETPAYLPSRETHLDLPLAQAYAFGKLDAPIGLVIGVVSGGILAIVLDLVMVNVGDSSLTFWGYVGVVGLAGLGGAIIAFHRTAKGQFPVRLELYDGLLMKAEEVTQLDLNGDGHIGEPEASPKVTIEHTENGIPRQIEEIDGVDVEQLKAFAVLIVQEKRSFSERSAKEAGITQEKFGKLRDAFVKRDWAMWKHPTEPKQGVCLKPKGMAVFTTLSPPLPEPIGNPKKQGGASRSSTQHGSDNLSQRYVPIEER